MIQLHNALTDYNDRLRARTP